MPGGTSAEEARLVASSLVDANLKGTTRTA